MKAIITGLGVLSPYGLGTEVFWSALLEARNAIAPITRFDGTRYATGVAGEVPGFDAALHLPSRLLPQTDRVTRFALVAAEAAFADAELSAEEFGGNSGSVVTANNGGGFEFAQREMQALWSQGPDHVSAYQSFAWFYAVNTGQISIRHGLKGPGRALVADDAGGMETIGHARRQLRDGSRTVLAGAVDTNLCPWGWSAYTGAGLMSHGADPDTAYRPFSPGASGFVSAEGGALMTVQSDRTPDGTAPHRQYAEIAGFASTFDGRGTPAEGLRRAIRGALADAGTDPAEVDVIFADGFGTADMDEQEVHAITAVFGIGSVPVTIPKAGFGRAGCGTGALDIATACLAIAHGTVPPTRVYPRSGRARDLHIPEHPEKTDITVALVLSRGRGGFNSATLLRRPGSDVAVTIPAGEK
ncbi:type II polyketide synthase, beta-ketoacyl synthase domain-containing protein [Nocardia nova SH22a]|uniref:Type II polyketide synthase, beta-ketoacyl synthase domain-containing protein n=1 Tax=Nocardia nova SH22a TaxID=1415166 RepID=W5T9M1_9NOCA|nr:beta-ketoacyl synthase N-terminal-like domain-containing protein [Nocardia nova]AHH15887.1 type II polyketide synthase, beta-ketoacyl synthase domain-containing protein [Nocardia nova SH22a]